MAVEFGLLGGVEACVGAEPVDLGPARQRWVLAALLVDANQVVSVDQLVDRVWGERPPQRAKGTLYSYISRLRQALAPAAEEVRLSRRSGGYVLTVDASDVDLHRFRALFAQARTAEDDSSAAALFEQALGLWRGEPFATVDTPWFCDLRQTLERERLSAELDNADVRLRSGLHGELLPTLTVRVGQHPLDERLAAQLMLALYRSGRATDALAHYQQIRKRLAGEMGTDPGPALQQLHQQILTADPALAPPEPEPASAEVASPVPRQLPARPYGFTGRDRQLAELTKALDSAGEPGGTVVISAIGGSGGIGKTWLALHWAHQNIDRFPDGQLYVDLRGFDPSGEPVAPAAAIRGLLDALGVDSGSVPVDVQAQIGLYRSLVEGRRILIVLDNAVDTEQASALLPGSATCTVLVTSRRRLTGLASAHGARIVTLDVLTDTEALELMGRHLGQERVAAEPEAVAALLVHCAGLPLAISVVAARAAAHPDFPLAALAEELQDESARLDALDAGELSANVRATFTVSYRALTVAAADVFRLVALAPGPEIGLSSAASLVDRPVTAVRAALRELENFHLVQQFAPGRYRQHDLLRLYAAEQAHRTDRQEERDAALRRLADFYLHTARAAEQLLHPHRMKIEFPEPSAGCRPLALADETEALAWLETQHVVLLATQRLAADSGWCEVVWRMAWVLDTFHRRNGHLHAQLDAWRRGLEAIQQLGDSAAEILARRNLGIACIRSNLHDEALDHLHRAMSLGKTSEDAVQMAHTSLVLAYAWERRENHQQALEHARHALALFQTLKTPVWEAQAHNQVCVYCARLGRYEEARAHGEASLALFRSHRDRDGEADVLGTLGRLAHQNGRHTLALTRFQQALALLRDIDHAYGEADALEWLGRVHAALGQRDQARESWQQAVDIYQAQHRDEDAEQLQNRLDTLPD